MPAQEVASRIAAELAKDVLGLKERIGSIDEELQKRFFARPEARILVSLPGMGPILGAEFLVAVGEICAFSSADRLAAYAGLVPAARDSGKRVGYHRRMQGETRPSSGSTTSLPSQACEALRSPEPSMIARELKAGAHSGSDRAGASEGQRSVWAMLRDETTFESRSVP